VGPTKAGLGILTVTTALSHRVRASRVLPLLVALPAMAEGQFNYATTNGAITITQYTGPGGPVSIPATIGGLPVTGIGGLSYFSDPQWTNHPARFYRVRSP